MNIIKRLATLWRGHERVSQTIVSGYSISDVDEKIVEIFKNQSPNDYNYLTVEIEPIYGTSDMCISYRIFDGVIRKISGSSTSWLFIHNLTNEVEKPPRLIPDAPELYDKLNGIKQPKKGRNCKKCGQKIKTQELWLICKECHTRNQQLHHNEVTHFDPLNEDKCFLHTSPMTPKRRA